MIGNLRSTYVIGFVALFFVPVSQRMMGAEELTKAQRDRIDDEVLNIKETGDDTASKTVNKLLVLQEVYGDALGWLIDQTPMPAEETRKQARKIHDQIVQESKTAKPAHAVEKVFNQLVAALPGRMKPKSNFTLTVIESDANEAFGLGAGFFYITTEFIKQLQQDGKDALAFELACLIGHECRGHAESTWKLLWLENEMKSNGHRPSHIAAVRRLSDKSIRGSKEQTRFAYSQRETYQADLFALHLCRNAGFDTARCLDSLRRAADEHSEPEESSRRLKQLLCELNGIVESQDFGLFEFTETTSLTKVAEPPLRDDETAVVFIHGMESDLKSQTRLLKSLLSTGESSVRIFGFQYPNNQSLTRSSVFLKNEIDRAFPDTSRVSFVCHSAGGLVFRFYAEVLSGKFRHAIFLGTPHYGSNLTDLRPLMEARQLLRSVKFGTPSELEKTIINANGQIGYDLEPDSLFLQHLNHDAPLELRKRYFIIRGKAFKKRYAVLMTIGASALRKYLRRQVSEFDNSELTRKCSLAWIEQLKVPWEVLSGDLAVSLVSAKLPGVAASATLPINHMQLTSDADALEKVTEFLTNED